ncbi:hypothetical protein M413DRAFT_343270 [Hebeloma cylindrosporum]|uniref:Uncharacterized protein n=1 Tax=Hebeloma cylindrosporum TaxID=76867 RepID=A0A0C3CN42_HEBCY|nr:hypothetical protein M413DRAFT_343270 [Hebeloma cylindrosporum h7]
MGNGLLSSFHLLTFTKAHRGQTIPYHKARRLISSSKPPWVYGFPLNYDYLTDTYGAKFVPTPPNFGPEPTELERINLDQKRASHARANLTMECNEVWPEWIDVVPVPGLSRPSGRTAVLAVFACREPNLGFVPIDEERVLLEALEEILVREGFSFPNELLAWFVAV